MSATLPTPRDLRTGLDACAEALVASADVIALAGGEGARRLWSAAQAHAASAGADVSLVLAGDEGGASALGHAAAGARVVLLASGPDWTPRVLRGLRALAQRALPAQLVVPAHGDETGGDLPADDLSDATRLLDAPVCVGVVADARQLGAATASMSLHARAMGRPCATLFSLRSVGLARLTGEAEAWDTRSAVTLLGDVHAPTAVLGVGEDLAPMLTRAVAAGAGPVRGVTVNRLRPGLLPALAEALQGVRRVVVLEAFPGSLGDEGWLTLIAHRALGGGARVTSLPRATDEDLAALEDPEARDLTLMPLELRRRLDLAGIKLSLAAWQSLDLASRAALARFPVDLDVDLTDFAAAVRAAVAVVGREVEAVPPRVRPWDEALALQEIRARVAPLHATVDAVSWAALREPSRFALAHLASPKRDACRLLDALRATGLCPS